MSADPTPPDDREAWLYANPEALESVRRGLREATAGEFHDLGRTFGRLRGLGHVGPEFAEPLPEDELRRWEGTMPPATATAPVAAINDPDTRRRLTPHAIAGFLGVAERWSLTVEDQQALLGGLGRRTVIGWEKQQGAAASPLSIDLMTRVSLLLGVYEGLERIFRRASTVADAWISRAKVDVPFNGRTPLEYMREGGLPAIATVRAYVDAWTGGPRVR